MVHIIESVARAEDMPCSFAEAYDIVEELEEPRYSSGLSYLPDVLVFRIKSPESANY